MPHPATSHRCAPSVTCRAAPALRTACWEPMTRRGQRRASREWNGKISLRGPATTALRAVDPVVARGKVAVGLRPAPVGPGSSPQNALWCPDRNDQSPRFNPEAGRLSRSDNGRGCPWPRPERCLRAGPRLPARNGTPSPSPFGRNLLCSAGRHPLLGLVPGC